MKQKRANKMIPVALAITTASALSAMALQSLPDEDGGGDVTALAAINPNTVGYGAGQLNIYENDLNPILGAPVYDHDRNVAGYVAELMVNTEGDVHGMVLAVPDDDTNGVKRVSAEAAEFTVVHPTAGETIVLAQVSQADLQTRPEFGPEYATDFH
ncbi:hypothetical protein [Aliiroseovarius sediminilitoris]|nr:hypothetical protein [Aliiroseovarius sediminilitoris]